MLGTIIFLPLPPVSLFRLLFSPPCYELSVSVPLVFANEAEICLGPFSSPSIFYAHYQGWVINSDTGNRVALLSPFVTLHRHTQTYSVSHIHTH